jgi:REP element-mobilizing transposase RayT
MKPFYHITCVTHNSRESNRMRQLKIKRGEPVRLMTNEEILFTKLFGGIVAKYGLRLIAYNICCDHIHLVIESEESLIEQTVQMLKSTSAIEFNRQSKKKYRPFWAQKFNKRDIESEEQLINVIEYVNNNRLKHSLEKDEELERIIAGFIIPWQKFFE